jgi:uncharacterized protein YnzC (UPF0291/DUF896 family)
MDLVSSDFKELEADVKKFTVLIKGEQSKFRKIFDDSSKSIKENNKSIKSLSRTQKESLDAIVKYTKANDALADKGKKAGKNIKDVDDIIKSFGKSVNDQKKLVTALTKEFNSLDPTVAKNTDKLKRLSKELISAREGINNMSKATRSTNNVLNRAKGSYDALTASVAKDVAALKQIPSALENGTAAYKKNEAQIQKLQNRIKTNTASLKAFDAQIGRSFRNVGNYSSALGKLGTTARSLGSAFGFVGGVFLLAQGVTDAVNTIRDFDKELVNMSAILGKNREDLEVIEKEIRRVAQSSINGAVDVAEMATSLLTLGQSEKDIVKLLSPVNDLSIALKAPADAAAELLIQTLNAFGESSDAAGRYGDIIAKMRTSTALDFERIKDSLGFVSPAANALGVSFEKTGALLGTLVDNGIKASRAGRLLSSSFARLNKEGITLDEALVKIQNSENKTKEATELFGTESFTLGLILADNTDKVNTYTESFENAGGALDALTKQQLESVDAKLKIVGASWDELILSIEKGDGVISNAFKSILDSTSEILTLFSAFNEGTIDFLDLINSLGVGVNAEINKTIALGKIAEKQNLKAQEDEKALSDIRNEAYREFNNALELGLNTFDEFSVANAGFFDTEGKDKEILLELRNIYEEYNKKKNDNVTLTEEEIKSSKKLQKAYIDYARSISDGIDLDNAIDKSYEYRKEILALGEQMKASDEEARSWADTLESFGDLNGDALSNMREEEKNALEEATEQAELYYEAIREGERLKLEAITTGFMLASDISNQYFLNNSIRSQNELEQFRAQKNEEIKAAKGNEVLQNQIRQQIAQKESEVRRKEHEERRKAALFNIAINLAEKIAGIQAAAALAAANSTAALAPAPFAPAVGLAFFGTVAGQVAVATGLAAVQAGLVLSQPAPAFEKGTDNAPGGAVIVNDGKRGSGVNRELITTPSGKQFFYDTDKPVYTNDIPKGSKIDPRDISQLTNVSSVISDYSPILSQNNDLYTSFKGKNSNFKQIINNNNTIDYEKLGSVISSKIPASQNITFEQGGFIKKTVLKGNTTRIVDRINLFKGSEIESKINKLTNDR